MSLGSVGCARSEQDLPVLMPSEPTYKPDQESDLVGLWSDRTEFIKTDFMPSGASCSGMTSPRS